MVKIAVVGATGPTGIHLVTELRKTVATVRVIARSMDKLARLFPEAAVEKWEADIRDADATLRAIEGCDLVYDCIGFTGHQRAGRMLTPKTAAYGSWKSLIASDLVAQSITLSKARFYGKDVYWLEGRSQELTDPARCPVVNSMRLV